MGYWRLADERNSSLPDGSALHAYGRSGRERKRSGERPRLSVVRRAEERDESGLRRERQPAVSTEQCGSSVGSVADAGDYWLHAGEERLVLPWYSQRRLLFVQ